nr:universal stress protein [Streptomyces sp. CBMA123]
MRSNCCAQPPSCASATVEVEHEVVFGRPVGALLGEATRALCLVVGSRGLGSFRGLLLGSVSHALVEHAECPLIVVPLRKGR